MGPGAQIIVGGLNRGEICLLSHGTVYLCYNIEVHDSENDSGWRLGS